MRARLYDVIQALYCQKFSETKNDHFQKSATKAQKVIGCFILLGTPRNTQEAWKHIFLSLVPMCILTTRKHKLGDRFQTLKKHSGMAESVSNQGFARKKCYLYNGISRMAYAINPELCSPLIASTATAVAFRAIQDWDKLATEVASYNIFRVIPLI